MKKYKISKYHSFICVFSLVVYTIPGMIFGIYGIIKVDLFYGWLVFTISFVTTVLLLYMMIFDFERGYFLVDETRIIMKVGLKKYEHNWNDFEDYGFVRSYAGNGYIYWVFLSTYMLTYEQRRHFLSKTRKDLENIAFFKYNDSNFDEILAVMPDELAAQLKEVEEEIREDMSWLEELYH